MQIGLIGGIGPAATDFYHRQLIATFEAAGAPLDLTIVYTDSPTLLSNLARGDTDAQIAIYQRLTDRLAAAGAGFVAVTSIAGHFCIEPFKKVSALPVVDLIEAVEAALQTRALGRVGILGTRTVMETGMYGAIQAVEIVAPAGDDLQAVHTAYVEMAAAGQANDAQRAVFHTACTQMIEQQGAEAIILGGTDLTLVYDTDSADIPVIDCAAIHVEAIAAAALRQ